MLFGHPRVCVAEIVRDDVQRHAAHDHVARRGVPDDVKPSRWRDILPPGRLQPLKVCSCLSPTASPMPA
jgi:hypothetical protein